MTPKTLDKIKTEALQAGLVFSEDIKGQYNLYSFQSCGHSQIIHPSKVRNGEFSCKTCFLEKITNEATLKNLQYLDNGKGELNLYSFQSCGHKQLIKTKHVRSGEFSCQKCKLNKIKKEARSVGLTYVSPGNNYKKIYRFKKCQHLQEILPGHVRNNSFACHACGESYSSRKSGIYIVLISNKEGYSFIKLGVSSNVKKRISQYKLPKKYTSKVLLDVSFNTNKEAVKIEKNIHKTLKDFVEPSSEMKEIIKSGFTECYNEIFLKKIISLIKKESSTIGKNIAVI